MTFYRVEQCDVGEAMSSKIADRDGRGGGCPKSVLFMADGVCLLRAYICALAQVKQLRVKCATERGMEGAG